MRYSLHHVTECIRIQICPYNQIYNPFSLTSPEPGFNVDQLISDVGSTFLDISDLDGRMG